MVEPVRVGADIDQLVAIEPARRRGGDVADVVRAGAARGEAELLHAREGVDDCAGLELAQLEVGARGDVGATVAAFIGEGREAAQLVRGDLAGRDAQAHHETVLGRGDVEEAVELEAEGVGLIGELVGRGVGNEFLPNIEAVFLVLPALGLREVGERRAEHGVFRRRGEVAGDGVAG